MTLFAFPAFPSAATRRLWDWFTAAGPGAVLQTALAVLALCEPALLGRPFEQIYAFIKKRMRRVRLESIVFTSCSLKRLVYSVYLCCSITHSLTHSNLVLCS